MNASIRERIPAITDICRRRRVRRLDLIGSAARGADPPGDFDFLVEFNELQLGEYADAYFGLLEDLQALLDKPVDLVMNAAVNNRFFRQTIDRDRIQLYAA